MLPSTATAAILRAGVGRADITPRTGYPFGGWQFAYHHANGQHTRLFASALVLERGGRKVALVAVDLAFPSGGMVKEAADLNRDRGFSEANVLVSGSHTHAGPAGFMNFSSLNTLAPKAIPLSPPETYIKLLAPSPPDRQLYTFLVQRLAEAIRRADADLAPAGAAWGSTTLLGVTRNRSLEAHLADHGIIREVGQGRVEEDPAGYEHTIDPNVDVLRVDKLVRCRPGPRRRCARVPIGGFSLFADHGTVNPAYFEYYNRDHHGAALDVFERAVRRAARVRAGQPVVNVYGNSDEGDISAALDHRGPAYAEYVGRREAHAMLAAWRQAGRRLEADPVLDLRWTRVCFCGQHVEGFGRVAGEPAAGLAALGGSEEGRTDIGSQEGGRSPVELVPDQGHKIALAGLTSKRSIPNAVPLMAIRIADRVIVSVPGEATAEAGRRIRAAVMGAMAGTGVTGAVVAGLANEYVNYFVTPEEYDRQNYEGGFTTYGPNATPFVQEQLVDIAGRLARGEPAPAPYPFDPRNGIRADGPPYGGGAESATARDQPSAAYRRLRRAAFAWRGGPLGLDRPLDRPFVAVERRVRDRWQAAADDLGLQILWGVDDQGMYRARWEIPLSAPPGEYRFVVTARRYIVMSLPFEVLPSRALRLRTVDAGPGRVGVELDYPAAIGVTDFTYRPPSANGGTVRFNVDGRPVVVRRRRGTTFSVPVRRGARVEIAPGDARDRYSNGPSVGLVIESAGSG